MQIRFMMSEALVGKMTWEEYEALEMAMEGQVKLYRIRPVMARFMVGEDGKYMDHEEAKKVLAKIEMGDMPTVVQAFVDGLRDSTVPKVNGTSSEQPSEASAAD